MSHGWTHAQCERCWILGNTTELDDGAIEIRRPTRLTEPELEICCFCGVVTIMGIYVRAEPDQAFCALRDEVTGPPEEMRESDGV